MDPREKRIFDILKQIALDDGVMKVDETRIISVAMRSAASFDFALKKALEDDVITDEEKNQLEELRKNIYEDAAKIAESDNIITKDEAKLLYQLLEIVEDLKNFEDLE